jgi:multiple sugar transport system permease protein
MAANVRRVAVSPTFAPPPRVWFVVAWQVVLGVGALLLALQIAQIERIFNLPTFVQWFVGAIIAGFGVASFAAAALIARGRGGGRVLAIGLDFIAAALLILYLFNLLGIFDGFDQLATGLYRNAIALVGVAVGYAIMWVGRRFGEDSPVGTTIERLGIAVMLLSIMAILLIPVWDVNNPLSGLLVTGLGSLISGLLRLDSILIVAGIAASIAALLILLRVGLLFGETVSERDTWQGWLFLMPNFINFALFFAGPLLLSFYLSFTDYNPVQQNPANFIGFTNYAQILSLSFASVVSGASVTGLLAPGHLEIGRIALFGNQFVIGASDPLFWRALGNTLYYCAMLLLLSIPTALGLAMLLNSKIPGMKFFRAIFFIPSVAAVVGVALIWQWLYNPSIGFINYALNPVYTALNGIFSTDASPPNWLTDDGILMFSVVVMAAWQVVGFNTVIFLAGLQGIPRELIEASTVDGAGRWTRIRKIMLPMLGPTTFFVTITTLIAGLQAFSEPYALIQDTNPTNAKLTAVYYLYNQGFRSFSMGYASAIAWALFIVIFIITIVQFRLSRSNQAYVD